MKKLVLLLTGFFAFGTAFIQAQDAPYFLRSNGIPARAVAGDLDNDGIQDLAWVTSDVDSLFTMLGNGDGTFDINSRRARVVPNISLISLALGNFNHNIDGNLDVVVVNAAFGGVGSAMVFFGNGDGSFGPPLTLGGFNIGAGDVVVADFNPQPVPPFTSNLDIASTFPPGNGVRVYFGDGNGGFSSGTNFTTGGTGPRHLETSVLPSCVAFACPANLVVSNPGSGNVGVLISNGVGGFSAAVPIGSGLDRGVAWVDFNGDGFLDIAAGRAAVDGGARVYLGTNSTGVAYNPTPLELTTPSVLHYRDVCAGDFNGDGNPDLFGASDVVLGGSGLTTFFLNDGAGGFSASKDDTLGVFINFTSCEAADINGNGLPDLLLGTVGSDSVAIYNLRAPAVTASNLNSTPPAGVAFNVTVTARDSTNAAGMKLFYRQMGKLPFDSLTLNGGPGTTQRTFTGSIGAGSVTIRGLEFYLRSTDGFITEILPSRGSINPLPLRTSISQNAPATADRTYQLVSFPFGFAPAGNGAPGAQIGDDFSLVDPNVARLFWWDAAAATPQYVEYPATPNFRPGVSMFLATNDRRTYDGAGLSTVADTTISGIDFVKVPLDTGWNMIATPYPYFLNYDSVWVLYQNGDVYPCPSDDSCKTWLGITGAREYTGGTSYAVKRILHPWKGYFVKNYRAERLFLLFPKTEMNIPNPNLRPGTEHEISLPLDWKIEIQAKSGSLITPAAVLGTGKEAKREYDRFDLDLPPALPGDLRIAFRKGADFGAPGDYFTDIRPPLAESETWSFSVQPGANRAIELNFDGLAEVPEDFDLILADIEGRTKQNLRIEPVYRFIASVERHFTLTVTPKNPGGAAALMPTTYELYQNLPNPFNPQTLIKYDLPEAADVKLDVFNILGQKVATLVNTYQAAGPKSVVWDGTDAGGAKVASGMYFYKINAGSYSATKKMMFIK